MAKIESVSDTVQNGEEGLLVEWRINNPEGMRGARFRAVMSTAMRFPTTITEVDVFKAVKEDGEFLVTIFVPTEGFPSVGITEPIGWARDQFGDLFD